MHRIGFAKIRRFLPLAVAFSVALCASATTIQDASQPGYVTGNSAFTGVVDINNGFCSGSLVAANLILTAGHCIAGGGSFQVKFQTPSGDTVIGVSSTALDPLFAPRPGMLSNLDQYDVGFLTLSSNAPADATIYPILTSLNGVTTSTVLDIVGYGLGGNPAVGILPGDVRRHAHNTYNSFGGTLEGVALPDNPIMMSMAFQQFPLDAMQGLINAGDSGSPAFVNTGNGLAVLGVASFGNLPNSGSYPLNTAFITGHESLADPNISAFVTSFIAADTVVPEPGSGWPVALSLVLLVGLAHHRRAFPSLRRSR